jgi:hypothetical protein
MLTAVPLAEKTPPLLHISLHKRDEDDNATLFNFKCSSMDLSYDIWFILYPAAGVDGNFSQQYSFDRLSDPVYNFPASNTSKE